MALSYRKKIVKLSNHKLPESLDCCYVSRRRCGVEAISALSRCMPQVAAPGGMVLEAVQDQEPEEQH